MLKIDISYLEKIYQASEAIHLHEYLQSAIELEHSTIPPYLTALYSIKLNTNQEAYKIILSVVREEMLHMTIAANVLNAIGGYPIINQPNFIPSYPGPLPMNIGGFEVGLAPLSRDVLSNSFMKIEEPENRLDFPVKPQFTSGELAPQFATIGQFYQAIIDQLQELGPGCIIPDRHQVVNERWFPTSELFKIMTLDDAVRALELIVQQGEGTSESPLENPSEPKEGYAHYYRFAEIYNGYRLRPDPSVVPEGYSYSGEPIPLEESNIWDLVPNSKADMYEEGTQERRLVDQFNYSYTNLLNGLHKTFNGEPDYLDTVMGLMFELKLQAQKMAEIPYEGKRVAPSFEYASVNA